MQWNPEPSLWQQIVQIGPFWLVVAFAGIAGVAAARLIIVPHDGPRDLGRADKLALWRTWVGFGVVAFISRPYRSPTETVDKALGNFNTSVPVSLGVYLVLIIIFWFTIKAQSRTSFGRELRSVFSRCVTFFLVLALSWWILAVFLSLGHSRRRVAGTGTARRFCWPLQFRRLVHISLLVRDRPRSPAAAFRGHGRNYLHHDRGRAAQRRTGKTPAQTLADDQLCRCDHHLVRLLRGSV